MKQDKRSDWNLAIESIITIVCGLFPSSVAWIYIICCQMLIAYYSQATSHLLEERKLLKIKRITEILSEFQQLKLATDILHQRFGLSLMINCCHAIITVFSSTYFLIRPSSLNDIKPLIVLDVIYVMETFLRLILTCHYADSVRRSVS